MLIEAIEQLKNILADLEQVSSLSIKVDSREKALEVCEISEHIQLAGHHLHTAINRMRVYQRFEKK
jgi:uncharacterized protein YgfB (UPF0149 family)